MIFAEVVLLLILGVSYLYRIARKSAFPLIDIRLIWAGTFLVYNLYSPVIFLFTKQMRLYYEVYGVKWYFEQHDMEASVLASLIYFAGFYVSSFICGKRRKQMSAAVVTPQPSGKGRRIVFYVWMFLTLAALVWYIYPYLSMGFKQAMTLPRWSRYKTFNSLRINMGTVSAMADTFLNSGLVLLGTFMMFCTVFRNKDWKAERAIWVIIFLALTFFFLFIDGRRRELLYIYLMCGGYMLFWKIKSKRKINYKLLVTVTASIAVIFFVYQYYKSFVQNVWTKGFEQSMKIREEKNKESKDEQIYETEFSLVYLTNLCTIRYRPVPFNGRSYLEALVSPIPVAGNILNEWFGYKNDKKSSIELWLAEKYPDLSKSGGGLGYSPVSEAYLNFGFTGCAVVGMLLGALLNLIYSKILNERCIVAYCILLTQAYGMNRIYFAGVTLELFWMFLYLIAYGTLANIIGSIGRHAEEQADCRAKQDIPELTEMRGESYG